jgi:hypothetical protein
MYPFYSVFKSPPNLVVNATIYRSSRPVRPGLQKSARNLKIVASETIGSRKRTSTLPLPAITLAQVRKNPLPSAALGPLSQDRGHRIHTHLVGHECRPRQGRRNAAEIGDRGYAEVAGYTIVDWFYDPAVKGSDAVTERPGFKDMLDHIAGNGVRTIVVESPASLVISRCSSPGTTFSRTSASRSSRRRPRTSSPRTRRPRSWCGRCSAQSPSLRRRRSSRNSRPPGIARSPKASSAAGARPTRSDPPSWSLRRRRCGRSGQG